jgi:hypothetical protein
MANEVTASVRVHEHCKGLPHQQKRDTEAAQKIHVHDDCTTVPKRKTTTQKLLLMLELGLHLPFPMEKSTAETCTENSDRRKALMR